MRCNDGELFHPDKGVVGGGKVGGRWWQYGFHPARSFTRAIFYHMIPYSQLSALILPPLSWGKKTKVSDVCLELYTSKIFFEKKTFGKVILWK